MTFFRSFLLTICALLLLAAAFTAGYLVRGSREAPPAGFPLIAEAYHLVQTRGIKPMPDPPAVEYGMIKGMLQAYNDPYTLFMEPAQNELESNSLQGSFGGIGVSLERDPQGGWLLFPFAGSPAQKAGIQDGDRLLSVENTPITSDTSKDAVQSALRGLAGSQVAVTVASPPDYPPRALTLTRLEMQLPSVTWRLVGDNSSIGLVQVNLIAASTADEIKRAIEDLQSRGANRFLLDLRNNPGGLLTSGVDVARLFLKDGAIMAQQYRGRAAETISVESPGSYSDLPLAVLIDHNSASAAEIIAGALKLHKRSILVGSPTYGKDSVQLVFNLEDGSSLHITAARWWIPGLEPPVGNGTGIQPDILVSEPESPIAQENDPVIEAAIGAVLQQP